MKKFFIGMIVGILFFSMSPVKALTSDYILKIADYKVMINGKEYKDDSLPILNYQGYTYAPMKSMLSSAGLNISWNAQLKVAEVTNNGGDKMTIYTIENVQYLEGRDIVIKNNFNYNFALGKDANGNKILNFVDKDGNILIQNIPFVANNGKTYINYDYYTNTLLPLIK